MTRQELFQVIGALNQLANNNNGNYVNEEDVLRAIPNDKLKTAMLDMLVRNNTPYILVRISSEITNLAHRVYILEDYVDSEEKYLNKALRALEGFKPELQRIQEYTSLLKQVNTLENRMAKYRESLLEGIHVCDYKCSLDNVKY